MRDVSFLAFCTADIGSQLERRAAVPGLPEWYQRIGRRQ